VIEAKEIFIKISIPRQVAEAFSAHDADIVSALFDGWRYGDDGVSFEILPSQPIAMQTLQDVYALGFCRRSDWSIMDSPAEIEGSPEYLAQMAKDLTPYATAQPIEQGEAVVATDEWEIKPVGYGYTITEKETGLSVAFYPAMSPQDKVVCKFLRSIAASQKGATNE